MKTNILVLSVLCVTLSSFTTGPSNENKNAAERMALQVVTSLRHHSAEQYATVYPSAEALLKLMDEHSSLYGNHLAEAQRDFEVRYQSKILPALNRSFYDIIEEGKKEGLDWKNVQLTKVNVGEETEKGTPVELILTANKVTFTIKYERTLSIDGQLKISPFVSINR